MMVGHRYLHQSEAGCNGNNALHYHIYIMPNKFISKDAPLALVDVSGLNLDGWEVLGK